MDTTGTIDFVLYSEVSLVLGVVVDHTPLTANYDVARLWTMKSIVIYRLDKDISGLYCSCRSLIRVRSFAQNQCPLFRILGCLLLGGGGGG